MCLLKPDIYIKTVFLFQDAIKELKTHTLMKKFYALNPKEKIKYLRERDLFKFIVVRHPFQRLVSGYRDKLENSSE